MKNLGMLILMVLFSFIAIQVQAVEPGDVGSSECLTVQVAAQNAVKDSWLFKSFGWTRAAAAKVVRTAKRNGEITDACAACIMEQFYSKIPIDQQAPCGTQQCANNSECSTEQFCNLPACDSLTGICESKPNACPTVIDPVCGCDGKTYNNECEAHAAGVSLVSQGECPPKQCTSNADCSGTEYCLIDKCAGAISGECKPQKACPDIYAPVCGCDIKTYGNECEAQAAGIFIYYQGECNAGTEACCLPHILNGSSAYCVDLPPDVCANGIGGPQGPGTSCATVNCGDHDPVI